MRARASSVRKPGRPGGFSLMEVLFALAVFGLAVTVLAASYISILQGLEAVKLDHAFAQEVRFVRKQVLLEPDLKVLEKGGETKTLDLGAVRWDVAVQATAVADLFEVRLHLVLGDDPAKRREQTETFQVLRPSWSDPLERGKLRAEAKQRIEDDRRRRGQVSSKRR